MLAAREIKSLILRCLEISESQGKKRPMRSLVKASIS
jgi:hypothetical protein